MARVIFSLQFDFERDAPGQSVQLIAPLDADGQSPHCRAVPPKQRVIDLRAGDWIRHGRKVSLIAGVKAFRDATLPPGDWRPSEGYLVRTE